MQLASERAGLLASHLTFTQKFFRDKEGQDFISAPVHKVICDAVDRVFSGKIKRLLITLPPGYGKTDIAVKYLIAKGFAINPRSRFIHTSYGSSLALDNSAAIKEIIGLRTYQTHWAVKLRADTSAKGLWRTQEGGHLRADAAGGSLLGFRAGILGEPGFSGAFIIDDPLKPEDADSEVVRENINARYTKVFKSRLAHEDVPMIVIMQRIHPKDFANHLLTGGGGEKFHHLMLPVMIDNSQAYPAEYTHGIPIPHGLPDGPLWEAKHTVEQINVLKRDGKVYAAQYGQNPRFNENEAFPPQNFKHYEVRPRTLSIGIIVDPSKGATAKSDRTAIAVIGIDSNANRFLLDGACHRMSLSERWEMLRNIWKRWYRMPGVVMTSVGYEQYGMQSDIAYIQERQELEGVHFPIQEVNWPRQGSHSKNSRIQRLEPYVKGSQFFLPATVYRAEDGGECFWEGTSAGFVTRRAYGLTSAQKRMKDAGEPWRIAETLKRYDENRNIYDVTWTLLNELKDFPSATYDDLSDVVSRIEDLDIIPAPKREVEMVSGLNEGLVA